MLWRNCVLRMCALYVYDQLLCAVCFTLKHLCNVFIMLCHGKANLCYGNVLYNYAKYFNVLYVLALSYSLCMLYVSSILRAVAIC